MRESDPPEPAPEARLADVDNATEPAGNGSALTRLLLVLNMFTLQHTRVHVDEVIAAFGVGQSTAYRYLRELSDAGLVASQGKGFYVLGRRIVELERMLQLSDPLLLAGKPVLDELQQHCINRAFLLCTPYNGKVLCVYKVGEDVIHFGDTSMPIQRGRGTALPLFTGAGSQVILAYLPPHQIKSLFLANPEEISVSGLGATWKDFRSSLSAIRKQGYARTLGRMNPGMYSLAVPIVKGDGRVGGSILMLGSAREADAAADLLPLLVNEAGKIGVNLSKTDDSPSLE